MSFKGILKYAVYVFIAGWMFLLGIMVGRGTAPVSFDTTGFQERLESIAGEFGKPGQKEGKIDLGYYDELDDPIKPEILEKQSGKGVNRPQKPRITGIGKTGHGDQLARAGSPEPDGADDTGSGDTPPVKTSKKAATLNKSAKLAVKTEPVKSKAKPKPKAVPKQKKKSLPQKKTTPEPKKAAVPAELKYTIQVAAYKEFKDAVTHMAKLEKKGFSASRTAKKIDGVTWYRVRVGAFSSYGEADNHVKKLNKAGINGMIIKTQPARPAAGGAN